MKTQTSLKFALTLALALLSTPALAQTEADAPSENPAIQQPPTFGEPNMGTADRLVRTGIGVGLATWGGLMAADGDKTGYYLLGASAIPFATAALARCPLYYIFGIDTRSHQSAAVVPMPGGVAAIYAFAF